MTSHELLDISDAVPVPVDEEEHIRLLRVDTGQYSDIYDTGRDAFQALRDGSLEWLPDERTYPLWGPMTAKLGCQHDAISYVMTKSHLWVSRYRAACGYSPKRWTRKSRADIGEERPGLDERCRVCQGRESSL